MIKKTSKISEYNQAILGKNQTKFKNYFKDK